MDQSEQSCPQKHDRAFVQVPQSVQAHLEWSSADESFSYLACAGHTNICENDGRPIGSMFCISYMKLDENGDTDPSRPVTFMFNGGPGSASILINVGGLGPRRVRPAGDKRMGPAPFELEDNALTLLRLSDLVVVDALGTGWSVLADGVPESRAYGLDADGECFARFVTTWLNENNRWNSPLYLLGESYGTTRNCVLVRELEDRRVCVNGVVMLSAIFDWTPTQPGNDANYIQLFPTCACIAQYFGRSAKGVSLSSEELFDQAAAFAETRLAPALILGDRLADGVEDELATQMASYIGLDPEYICAKHLRVELTDFRQELLRDKDLVCGRLDGRFTFEGGNFLQRSSEGCPEEDPSDVQLTGPWNMAFRHHVCDEIGYSFERAHIVSSWDPVGLNWVHAHRSAGAQWKSEQPNVAYDLAKVMRHNPHLRVLILGGRYDMATPYLGPLEDMARMYLGDDIKANLTWRLYDSGHMIYVNDEVFPQLYADLAEFYAG